MTIEQKLRTDSNDEQEEAELEEDEHFSVWVARGVARKLTDG